MMVKEGVRFIQEAVSVMVKNDLMDAAAALAFHTLLALAPVLVFVVFLFGGMWGREATEATILSLFEDIFEMEVTLLEGALDTAYDIMSNVIFVALGLFVSLYAAVNLVNHVRKRFFALFNVHVTAESTVARHVKDYLLSFGYALFLFIIVSTLMVGQGAVALFFSFLRGTFEGIIPSVALEVAQVAAILAVVWGLFALMYRLMSAGSLSWRSLRIGALAASALFILFNLLLSIYAQYSIALGLYGTSAFLMVLLVWVYVSASIIFFGGAISVVVQRQREGHQRQTYI